MADAGRQDMPSCAYAQQHLIMWHDLYGNGKQGALEKLSSDVNELRTQIEALKTNLWKMSLVLVVVAGSGGAGIAKFLGG